MENESVLVWVASSALRYLDARNEFVDENLMRFLESILEKLEMGLHVEEILKFLKRVIKFGDLEIIYMILNNQKKIATAAQSSNTSSMYSSTKHSFLFSNCLDVSSAYWTDSMGIIGKMLEIDDEQLTKEILTMGFLGVIKELVKVFRGVGDAEMMQKKLYLIFVLGNICAGPVEVKAMITNDEDIREFLYS